MDFMCIINSKFKYMHTSNHYIRLDSYLQRILDTDIIKNDNNSLCNKLTKIFSNISIIILCFKI